MIPHVITEAADRAVELLEARKGLKHRNHARHIGPARADVEKVLRHYWARQEAAVLAEIKPRLAAILAQHPAPAMPVHEAADGEWVTIHGHPVLIGGGAEAKNERVERAKKSQVVTKKAAQRIADHSEQVLADGLSMSRTPDNSPFDLRTDEVGVEVKTMVNQKNDKITMSKAAIGRKLAEQRAEGIKIYTVVADRRAAGLKGGGNATYYYREGVGSFRLGQMTKVSMSELRSIVKQ
jgi:hypothetical protein